MTHVFGLTGGIGSGKSTVAARWRARGLPVVDADVLAREVVAPGTPGLRRLVEEFGREVLDADGALDRKRLAARVFAEPAARKRLEAITHPLVREAAAARFLALSGAGEPLACYEVPLLVESGLAEALRPLVVVSVDAETQVARTVARDGCTEAEARARLAAQMPLVEKARLADHVLDNSGALAATLEAADETLDAVCRGLGIDVARYPRPAAGT